MLNQLPVARLGGKTAIVATKILCSQQDVAPFYRIAEVHFAFMRALEVRATSEVSCTPPGELSLRPRFTHF